MFDSATLRDLQRTIALAAVERLLAESHHNHEQKKRAQPGKESARVHEVFDAKSTTDHAVP